MNEQQKANLIKLAIGLADPALVKKYNLYFDMEDYTCRSSACAIGFGPLLVGERKNCEFSHWEKYSDRVFGQTAWSDLGFWMFASTWADVDNTPKGAAARILYALEYGVPYSNYDYSVMKEYQADAYKQFDRLLKEAQQ